MAPLIRLRAISLVETIVALVILVLVFSIATYFMATIEAGAFNSTRARAAYVLDDYMARSVGEKAFTPESVQQGPFYLERTATFVGQDSLLQLEGEIFDQDHRLLKRKRILLLHE